MANLLERLNVRMVGSGEKIVVLAHGFGTDQSSWSRIHPSLSFDHRVVLFDLAFAGTVNPDSFDFNHYATLNGYVEDLLYILDALGIDSCTYVGHSISATIGMLASIRRPNIFTKIITIGFTPSVINQANYYGGFERAEVEAVLSAMESNYMAWVCGTAPLAVGADIPEAVQEYSRTLFNMRPGITRFVSQMVLLNDNRGILSSVTVPCCLIQTARDMAVPASVPTYVMNHLGGESTMRTLNVEGHLPQLSAPEPLTRVLREELPR